MQHNDKYAREELGKNGLSVVVRMNNNMSFEQKAQEMDKAIRAFKRKLNQEGWSKDIREKEYHETKGQKRRKAQADAIMRERMAKRRQQHS